MASIVPTNRSDSGSEPATGSADHVAPLDTPNEDTDGGGAVGPGHRGDSRWPSPSPLAHHVLLGLVTLAVLPLVGAGAVWSADEGALLYQATAVVEGRGWRFDHPFPAVDPDGGWFPIHLAAFADGGGYVVLGKHTGFVVLAGLLHQLGGYPAVLAFSALSGVAAAATASALARRIDPRGATAALWLTGAASPLFLSSLVAWAHTIGAALIGVALLGLTTTSPVGDRHRPHGWRVAAANATGAVALLVAVGVRTEALLAGIALTLALAVPVAIHRMTATAEPDPSPPRSVSNPDPHAPTWRPAVLAAVATVVGFLADRATAVPLAGPVRAPGDRWGGLAGRLEGFAHTWLRPDFSNRPEHLLLALAAAALIGAAVVARDGGAGQRRVVTLLALAATSVVLRFLVSPLALIPGLLVAFPVLFAGLALLRRPDLRRGPTMVLVSFVALFWAAVLATQYRYGGGGEWGGRYFALGLPAAVAVAAPRLVRTLEPLRGRQRRLVLGLGAVVVVLPVAMGLLAMADVRDRTEALNDRVDEARTWSPAAQPGDGGLPVVLSTLAPAGRWAWADVDRSRWLLVDEGELDLAGPRLRAAGIDHLVLVTGHVDDDLPLLAPWYEPIGAIPAGPEPDLARVVIPLRAAG